MRRLLVIAMWTASAALAASVDFERDIKPIFRDHCWPCHGVSQQMATLRLDRRDAALIGGRGKMAIVPGGPDRSLVYRRVSGIDRPQMPPTGPLTPEQIDIIKAWIEQGAPWPDDPPAHHDWQPDARMPALLGEIRNGSFAPVRAAVTADPKLARARDERGTTLLMQASLYGTANDVRWLLDHGADPNAADLGGVTALMNSVENGAKVALLLKAGADPNTHSIDGRTALLLAVDRKHSADAVRPLLERGANPNAEPGQNDPLVQVARNGDLDSIKLLAAARNGKYPPAALAAAAQSDCFACLRLVLDSMPPKTALSDALRAAAVTSPVEYMVALLDAGADPNAKDPVTGQTALMRAAYSDLADPRRVGLLLDHGADLSARANDGDTAAEKAARKGHTEVAKMLNAEVMERKAEQTAAPADSTPANIRAAVQKALALLQKTGPSFWAGSGCISCHHQSLPAMAVSVAREHGFDVDESAARAAVKLAADYMDARRERLLEGISPPGGIDTTSYILFGLAIEHQPSNESLEAAARYLRIRQADDGSWAVVVHRPPLESSTITVTALTMRDLIAYAPPALRAQYAQSVAKGAAWLAQAQPRSNEDYAYKILGLSWAKGSKPAITATASGLLKQQRMDGGWGQIPSLPPDAYATGQALFALATAGIPTTDRAYRRGVEFLLRTQKPDGSWHVVSRAEPVQIYFESGFPHGVDQFISAAGTSWAVAALAVTNAPGKRGPAAREAAAANAPGKTWRR
jgi:ankyrin repeat protein